MYHKAKDMLQKARQPKHGGYKTILERWHNDDQHGKSLSEIGWTEEQIVQYDELALEDQSFVATRGERDPSEKSWVLKVNKEGAQGPTNQRPDFVEAKREMNRLHYGHVKETSEGNTPIHPVQRSRQRRGHQFEGLEENNYQTYGEPILRSHGETLRGIQHIRHCQLSGSSTTTGSRTKVGILGDPHPGLNSSAFSVQRCFFACRKENFLAIVRGVDRCTCRTPHCHMYSHSTEHTAWMTCVHWLKGFLCAKIGHSCTRHVSSFAARDTEHFLTFSFFYLFCVVVVFFSEPGPVVHVSNCPLRRSTAGWHFLLHRNWIVTSQ